MCILIFAKLHQDTNPTNIAEEKKNALFSMVQKNTNAKITKFATYGTHFNLSGTLDILKVSGIKVNYVDLIIKTLDGNEISIKTDFKCTDNSCSFSTSTNINEGLNLETLDLNNYYFFIKVTYSNSDIQYYSLENNSEYSDIEYYTITKNNSNNKINISFKNKSCKNIPLTTFIFNILFLLFSNIIFAISFLSYCISFISIFTISFGSLILVFL